MAWGPDQKQTADMDWGVARQHPEWHFLQPPTYCMIRYLQSHSPKWGTAGKHARRCCHDAPRLRWWTVSLARWTLAADRMPSVASGDMGQSREMCAELLC
jgi:hypothetical protein